MKSFLLTVFMWCTDFLSDSICSVAASSNNGSHINSDPHLITWWNHLVKRRTDGNSWSFKLLLYLNRRGWKTLNCPQEGSNAPVSGNMTQQDVCGVAVVWGQIPLRWLNEWSHTHCESRSFTSATLYWPWNGCLQHKTNTSMQLLPDNVQFSVCSHFWITFH